MVLNSADIIDNDQDKSYTDLKYFMSDVLELHVVITSQSSTVKKMTTLNAVKVIKIKPLKATELFQRFAKMTEQGLNITKEVDEIVKELEYLTLTIILTGLYVSVTAHLLSNIRRYLSEYR